MKQPESGQGLEVSLRVDHTSLPSPLDSVHPSDGWGCTVRLLAPGRGRESSGKESGPENGGPSSSFSVPSPSRFSVRFKDGSVAVKVIQGPEGSRNGKLICKKKGSHSMEVTVQ